MANTIGWGEGVLNTIGWGANGQSNGEFVTNILTEDSYFLETESNNLLIIETTTSSNGWGSAYDLSYSGETLLER